MQIANGGIISVIDLYSTDGILRNKDVVVRDNYVFVGQKQTAVAAGNTSVSILHNPAGSGIVMLVDELQYTIPGAFVAKLGLDPSGSFTAITYGDSLNAAGGASVGQMLYNNGAYTMTALLSYSHTGGEDSAFVLGYPILLNEGESVGISTSQANGTLSTRWLWREYTI